MLEFNPNFRASANELIKDPLFDSIRKPEMEIDAPYKIEPDNEVDVVQSHILLKNDKHLTQFFIKKLQDEVKMIKWSAK